MPRGAPEHTDCMFHRPSTTRWRRGALVAPGLLLALTLAGCGGGPVSNVLPGKMFDSKPRDLPAPQPDKQALPDIPYCPPAQIREGTQLFRKYERGKEGDDEAIVVQGSITETARECSYSADVTTVFIKVGVAGRAVLGPRGAPGTYEMPVRIAVITPSGEPLSSQLFKVPATIPEGATNTDFSHVQEGIVATLSIPDDIYGYRIYVGFDEGAKR